MRYLLTALILGLFATPAMAEFQGPASGAPATTVRDALDTKWDDTKACIEGNIVSKVSTSSEKYTFKDATGSMTVEIDDEIFAGVSVSPSTKVRICGEIDHNLVKSNDFDVKSLQIIGQ